MRNETINKALAHLPATREELGERLGLSVSQISRVARHLVQRRYAEEWGQKATTKGTLACVLRATGKVPV